MSQETPPKVHQTSQTSFTSNAVLYDKARPSYIPSSVDALVKMLRLQKGDNVLDLACGTGIFTRTIMDRGFDLTAAEPSPGMIKAFSARTPEIPIHAAGAHNLPFPDESFDAVTIAQAFHWFADEESLIEIARVLKPNGRLGLIWNLEKTGISPFADEYFHAVVAHDEGLPQYRKNEWMPVLKNTKVFQVPYEEYLEDYFLSYTPEQLWDRTQSKSFITSLSAEEQGKLRKQLDHLVAKYPETPKDSEGKLICPQFVRVIALQKA
ncbi:Uncharacterized methyltransferase-like C25B8.10 [Taphrina deformans PYCC 5710]|uniref:Uncharacterized methyltransferase-like C25B8.10 n=1 Tax=Taphrina deformans (strain PYCC 5710 / ATCC 11124 / CBS 356.35 / IMI 108563 / JCM 9778 / NBRC 8474) TaxID=1097556 RepID=R4XCK8_TAPDE|nr:Uncharacterized methyltransferase-like C25B8.10 [Taphrina deformans PYCC 5710]|eukprot:CCG82101.1 Uncharacterized methyltransferase-like C25B8.10 [Taphrina deformans PYCC 5710]